ncbi:MAG: ATP synthase F1 subunit epsilon [Clostridiales bacterium]|nr:ATP synthase F1 subunit epsilon [Clostridiales bacterium]
MAERSGKKTNLVVVTPYKNFFEGRVDSVSLPSLDGEIGIMASHTPVVIALKPGIVNARIDKEYKHFTISEGYAEIGHNIVLIVCNSAEWPEEIKVGRIFRSHKDAYENVKEIMAIKDASVREDAKRENDLDFARAKARKHLIELYGSERQRARLEELLSSTPRELCP